MIQKEIVNLQFLLGVLIFMTNKNLNIIIRVSKAEKFVIITKAQECNLTVGEYLRTLGTGSQPRSIDYLNAIGDLAKINADLGRLGGLLKLWLTDDLKITYYSGKGIVNLLSKIISTREKMEKLIDQVLKERL